MKHEGFEFRFRGSNFTSVAKKLLDAFKQGNDTVR